MDTHAYMGFGPKIIVAIQDGPKTTVYTGIVIDGDIQLDNDYADFTRDLFTYSIPTGRKTIKMRVEFALQDYGPQMKTWADIRTPEEINAPRNEITE